MKRFLYGAAVQGIQGFILQTNKLKEIVGASELVEEICTRLFAEQIGISRSELATDSNAILNAAGNIKYVFDDKESCNNAFMHFPKKVMEFAPGITISQAVVEWDEEEFSDVVDRLEKRLRIQRNIPTSSITTGNMGMQRSRTTGLPAVGLDNGEFLDKASQMKRMVADRPDVYRKAVPDEIDSYFRRAFDISNITGHNEWIAVVHADGNGLGQIVRRIGGEHDKLHLFSLRLEEATKNAATAATKKVAESISPGEERTGKSKPYFPLRPIVLGGDDLTVIIRGDLAVEFTKTYLAEFEKQTQSLLGDMNGGDGLTACAGIAFVKSSFPYYYGYQLAEELCEEAKKDSKSFKNERVRSCLMFHKVQDSFVESYDDITERELTVVKENESFKAGPYYLEHDIPAGRLSITELEDAVKKMDGPDGNAVKSGIRQWTGIMLQPGGHAQAAQKLNRMKDNVKGNNDMLKLIDFLTSAKSRERQKQDNSYIEKVYPAYDALALFSIMYQTTK
mgnify:CR=1 FL=1